MQKHKILQPGPVIKAPLLRQPNPARRILVVDDDPLIRRLSSEVLIQSGYHVDAADDGRTAWHALLTNDYDLMITDHDMPKVTGVDLLRKVHATRMAMPIIMATSTVPAWEFSQYPWLRPAAVVIKPFTFVELLETVKHVLHAAAPAQPWYDEPAEGG